MSEKISHHAVLQNWFKIGDRISGEIYFDHKRRFVDGERVTTSSIDRFAGDTLFTKNSIYLLGKQEDI